MIFPNPCKWNHLNGRGGGIGVWPKWACWVFFKCDFRYSIRAWIHFYLITVSNSKSTFLKCPFSSWSHCQILPCFANYCRILPKNAKFCRGSGEQEQTTFGASCHCLPIIAEYCQTLINKHNDEYQTHEYRLKRISIKTNPDSKYS